MFEEMIYIKERIERYGYMPASYELFISEYDLKNLQCPKDIPILILRVKNTSSLYGYEEIKLIPENYLTMLKINKWIKKQKKKEAQKEFQENQDRNNKLYELYKEQKKNA